MTLSTKTTTTPVSSAHPAPMWQQAAEYLGAQIEKGALREGSRLPPERELCARLQISRVTLRKALLTLVEDGVLRSSHGRGWYVASGVSRDFPNSLESFSETARRMGLVASSRVLRCEIAAATIDEAEELMIAPGTPLFRLERVRLLSGVPIALDDSRIEARLAPGLVSADFGQNSLFAELVRAGLDLARADSTIEAQSADAALAAHLGIGEGRPILVMHQTVVDSGEHPLLTSSIRYAGDRYRLRTSFSRPVPGARLRATHPSAD